MICSFVILLLCVGFEGSTGFVRVNPRAQKWQGRAGSPAVQLSTWNQGTNKLNNGGSSHRVTRTSHPRLTSGGLNGGSRMRTMHQVMDTSMSTQELPPRRRRYQASSVSRWPRYSLTNSVDSARRSLRNIRDSGAIFRGVSANVATTAAQQQKTASGDEMPLGQMMRALWKEFWPKNVILQLRVYMALALLVAAKVLNVQVPVIFKNTIDALGKAAGGIAVTDAIAAVPLTLLVSYGIVRIAATAFNELRSILFARVCQTGVRSISQTTLDKLLGMDYSFHINRQSGALSKAIDRGHRSIDFALRALTFTILPTILEGFLVGKLLLEKCGLTFMAVTFLTMGSYLVYTIVLTQWRTKFYKQANELENKASSAALDSLLNFETVKYFGNEKLELTRYEKILKEHQEAYLKSVRSLSLLNFGQSLIFSAGLTVALSMSARAILAGTSTLGDIVMIQTLLLQLSLPLAWLGSLYRELRQANVDMATIFNLRNTRRDVVDAEKSPPLEVTKGRIEYQNVHFGYNVTRKILDGVNLNIPGGSKVAFVGSTGCGKSSSLRLLFRFYDPWEGKVFIDGQDIAQVSLESLRKSVGVVPQDVVLFNDDIMYNIKYGCPDATDEEAIKAAKSAKIHDAIMRMPDGYKTIVGERGLKLSGGEKQRLAIARLLLKKPKIVVFDEATSSLDMQTEREIMASLDEVTKGCTTVMVAHRLETVKDADVIFVFEDGRIEQAGSHTELIQQGKGLYSRMWAAQTQQEAMPSSPTSPTTPALT